jgi:hypothetical protein
MYIRLFVFFLALISSVCSLRADTIPLVFKSFKLHYGFIIPHSSSIRDVSFTNPVGVELNIGKLHTSFRDWQVFNNFWASGIKGRYFNFQFPDVLGSVFDFSAFAGPLVSNGRNHQFIVAGGAGISYHTKIYHPEENPLNQFFSTRISFPLYIDALFKYRISQRSYVTLAGSYNHISNGGVRQPNFGMNYPTISLGIERFNHGMSDLDYNYKEINQVRNRDVSVIIQGLSSYRVIDATDNLPEKGFIVYGVHMRASKPLGSIYSLNTGAEFIVDGYIRELIRREGTDYDHKRFALTLGQDFTFGKILFVQHLGIYLYSPYEARNKVYQKYELAYKTRGRLLYSVFLKAHVYVAELIGVGINYQFL